MNKTETLTLAIQKKGRLSDECMQLLKQAGFSFELSERSLSAKCSNFPLEILFLRAEDIPEIVADKTADIGICGQNSIAEKDFDTQEIEPLGFGKCRLSLAVAAESADNFRLDGKRIATSYPKLVQKYLDKRKISAEPVSISGSVEIAPKLGIAEVICDLVSSGSTLKMNGLIETEMIFQSEAVLFSASSFPDEKLEILEKFCLRIRSVLIAKRNKYIVMNAPKSSVASIKKCIPGLQNPTIAPLADPDFVSLASVVEEDYFWETIEKLKAQGATGILVLPIEKMIL